MQSVYTCNKLNLPVGGFGLFKIYLRHTHTVSKSNFCACGCVKEWAPMALDRTPNRTPNAPVNRVRCRFKVILIFQLPIDLAVCERDYMGSLYCAVITLLLSLTITCLLNTGVK